jgi:hypothetical protein
MRHNSAIDSDTYSAPLERAPNSARHCERYATSMAIAHIHATSVFILCIALFALLLTGCDDLIYTQGEMEAKRQFEAIKKGQPRQSVDKALGTPAYELVMDSARGRYRYVDPTGKQAELDSRTDLPSNAPPELRFLPKKQSASRVLIYSAGTVFGYIGLSEENLVTFVQVVVS